jgi:hypothetical protein
MKWRNRQHADPEREELQAALQASSAHEELIDSIPASALT